MLDKLSLAILALAMSSVAAFAQPHTQQDASGRVVKVFDIADKSALTDCQRFDFVGKVVAREFAENSITLSGLTLEYNDGTRSFINVDAPASNLDMATLGLATNGLQRLSKVGRIARGNAFACGAAGRFSYLDELQ